MAENENDQDLSLILSSLKLDKTSAGKSDLDILGAGLGSIDDFFENFEYLIFCLDGSGSMGSAIEYDSLLPGGGTEKVELERRAILKYVRDKVSKRVLNMKIGVVEFDNAVKIRLSGSSDIQEIEAAVMQLAANGGTSPHKGIRAALTLIRKSKNAAIPRIILTSDGEFSEYDALEAADAAKAAGVVIDTIYIGAIGQDRYSEMMRKISQRTGGVHEMITNEREFEQKFLKVAARQISARASA